MMQDKLENTLRVLPISSPSCQHRMKLLIPLLHLTSGRNCLSPKYTMLSVLGMSVGPEEKARAR